MLVSSRRALEALEAIGHDRETGWAMAMRALVAIAKAGTELAADDARETG
jgi:hypothetical protein